MSSKLFNSIGGVPSLGMFLRSLNRETIAYRGGRWYEAFCAAHIHCHRLAAGQKSSLFMPSLPPDLRQFFADEIGIVFADDIGSVKHELINDDPETETVLINLYAPRSKQRSVPYHRNTDPCGKILVFEAPFLGMSQTLQNSFSFSWEALKDSSLRAVITTDWKMHFVMTAILGIPSLLLQGPKMPEELIKAFSIHKASILPCPRPPFGRCPCVSAKFCQDRSADRRPCINSFSAAEIISAMASAKI